MALADIQKKNAEDRKREKRLVHATNALSRDYLGSRALKAKTKTYKATAEYLTKSLLDYLFFVEKKELKEINENHIHDFLLIYAPGKLTLPTTAKEQAADILSDFIDFLHTTGHIKNGEQLNMVIKKNKKAFQKEIPSRAGSKKAKRPVLPKKKSKTKPAQKVKIEAKVGRNDPCPCGSGKKFKKCCGQK
jgi:hypothetical protein